RSFNILQEGDLQIRGFKLRLPLDIQFIFTANPEDYTNRGSIITPLKDRIESQILTHYPKTIDLARQITQQEARISEKQKDRVQVSDQLQELIERVSFTARESELIDEKSGVSARLSISGYENLVSTAERRALINKEGNTNARITDFWGVIPAITGKVELVYEGEQEGPYGVAIKLLGAAIKEAFLENYPNPSKFKKGREKDPYGTIKAYFAGGNTVNLENDSSDKAYHKALDGVAGLEKFVDAYSNNAKDKYLNMELVLHGLSEFNVISKDVVDSSYSFGDILSNMWEDMGDLDDLDN
ncbi:MAG: magnesium chelatase, partial [Bacteroidota bacterium]